MGERLRPCVLALSLVALSAPLACDSDEPNRPGSQGGAAGNSAPAAGAGQGGASSSGASAGGTSAAGASSAGTAGDAPLGGAGAEGGAPAGGAPPISEPQVLPTTGDTKDVHDPFIVKDGATYYLFSTGVGVSVRTSSDLLSWKAAGRVFASKPSWITTTAADNPNHLWAPEVGYFGGKFHLYYSASSFGSNNSCIGHATRTSLSSGGGWVDDGQALVCSKDGQHDYNAIDPSPFQDEDGQLWLAFGSFWSGLKLIRLNSDGRRDGPDLFSLSTRPHPPGAVEAPQLVHHDGFYYLFESVDSCCRGVDSTYKMMVGRSSTVIGPYVDKAGDGLLADEAGTLLLEGNDRYRGPGHNAILVDGDRYYNVYHAYDANDGGAPYLRIADLIWDEDGWPISAGP